MDRVLSGRTVLVLEDEPLILLDIVQDLEAAGAFVLMARRLDEGLRLAEHPKLSAAVLDYGLPDGGGVTTLCERLIERRIPFVMHTAYSDIDDVCRSGIIVPKPAPTKKLVSAVQELTSAT